MKTYDGENVRNVAVIGHSHSGKTSLVSALLYTSGGTPRLGRVDDGSSATDYDEEEISRQMTISAALAALEWNKTKINLIDTPGFNMFVHEAELVVPAVDAALVVVDSVSGAQVVTQKVWKYADGFNLPRIVVCTRMDRERADFERVMESLTTTFGRAVVPVQLPIGAEKNFKGVIDLVKMKAYMYDIGGNGRSRVEEIPAGMAEKAKAAHEALVELVAEGDDELMSEFFETGTIGEEHIVKGIHNAIREDRLFPVLFASGLGNIGSDEVLDFLVDYVPTAVERKTYAAAPAAPGAEPAQRSVDKAAPLSLFVFKTISDPFSGRISYFKVVSGVLKNDATVTNFTRGTLEKFAHISAVLGKQLLPVPELSAGDIGAVAKLKDTLTGDSLGDKSAPVAYPKVVLPEPAITFAIEPKTRADEDKLGAGVQKMKEEDPMLRFFRDPQTKDFLIAGTGQQHIEVVVSKLKRRYHTEVVLKAPKVPYRETIRGTADVQGRHKKQSGGHGQFGDCKIKMSPLERGKKFEFVNSTYGGSIPKNFIPAVEKGILEAAARGYLAGYPVVDFRVELYDGSYHDVDSNEMSFKTAGRIAFKKAMELAKPSLLEPVMQVEITVPDEFAGAIMGDMNSRRGRIQGMDNQAGNTIIKAHCPMSEMLTYGTDLTAMTQGRGSFNMEMDHYDFVPGVQQEKIIAAARAAGAGLEEEEEE
ncbi:MAG: elongation factor G [Acidobacteriota bacterium]|nr:elongation factor G [Acidobacteriota bacterium]